MSMATGRDWRRRYEQARIAGMRRKKPASEGMSPKEVQALQTGDKVEYAGRVFEIVDWKTHLQPVFFFGQRVDAEPIGFDGERRQMLSTHTWEHMKRAPKDAPLGKTEKPEIASPAKAGGALFRRNQEASREYKRRMDEWRPRYEADAKKMAGEITTEGHKRQMMKTLLDKQVSALETARGAQASFIEGGRVNPGDFIKMTYWAAVSDLTGLLVRSLTRLKVRQDVR